MQANEKTTAVMQYAEVGAQVRLGELEQERQQIFRMFPRLNGNGNGSGVMAHPPSVVMSDVPKVVAVPKRRKKMSTAQREAIRRRMFAYWKQKRQAKK
jgi:hypothetical protein